MEIKIQAIHFTADQKLLEYIDKKLQKLEKLYDRIDNVEVFLKLEDSGVVKDKAVEVKVHIPGTILFASATSKKFEEAAGEAIDNVKRQLQKHKEKIQDKY